MAAELDAVLAAEVSNLVGVFPVVDTLLRLSRLRLHRIFSGDAVEFPLDEGNLVRVADIGQVHGDTDAEVILVVVLESILRWLLDASARLGLGECRNAESDGAER